MPPDGTPCRCWRHWDYGWYDGFAIGWILPLAMFTPFSRCRWASWCATLSWALLRHIQLSIFSRFSRRFLRHDAIDATPLSLIWCHFSFRCRYRYRFFATIRFERCFSHVSSRRDYFRHWCRWCLSPTWFRRFSPMPDWDGTPPPPSFILFAFGVSLSPWICCCWLCFFAMSLFRLISISYFLLPLCRWYLHAHLFHFEFIAYFDIFAVSPCRYIISPPRQLLSSDIFYIS